MDIILALLIEWLHLNTDIKIETHPSVVTLESSVLNKKFGAPVYALYDKSEKTVYLSNDIDLKTIRGASILVHELVHHYQNVSGAMDSYSCIQESEKLAYETQRHYLEANKAEIMPELNPFNILMRSLCEEV